MIIFHNDNGAKNVSAPPKNVSTMCLLFVQSRAVMFLSACRHEFSEEAKEAQQQAGQGRAGQGRAGQAGADATIDTTHPSTNTRSCSDFALARPGSTTLSVRAPRVESSADTEAKPTPPEML